MNTQADRNIPLEIELRYLIEECNPETEPLKSAPRYELEQTYLTGKEGTSERVRKSQHEETVTYTHTIKKKLRSGVREEDEKQIDADEYETLLERADKTRATIIKTRWKIQHDQHTWEIDHMHSPRDVWLAEVELKDEAELNTPLTPPRGVDIIEEVTNKNSWTNSSLAEQTIATQKINKASETLETLARQR